MSLRVTVQVRDRIEFSAGDLSPFTDKEKLTRAWEVISATARLATEATRGPDAVTVSMEIEYGPLELGDPPRRERFAGHWWIEAPPRG